MIRRYLQSNYLWWDISWEAPFGRGYVHGTRKAESTSIACGKAAFRERGLRRWRYSKMSLKKEEA
jgi:hypothetical protein